MTNTEAITLLRHNLTFGEDEYSRDKNEAIQRAIKALENETKKYTYGEPKWMQPIYDESGKLVEWEEAKMLKGQLILAKLRGEGSD